MSWQTILNNLAGMIPYANHFITATSFLFLCTVLAHWVLPSQQPFLTSRKLFDTFLSLVAIALWVWVSTFQSGNVLLVVVMVCAFFLSFLTAISVGSRFEQIAFEQVPPDKSRKAIERKKDADDDERKEWNALYDAMSDEDKETMSAFVQSRADARKKEKK